MNGAASRAHPLAIAHRAGNDLELLTRAFAAGVDYAEADVWFHRGRLEVRHDKTAGPLPVLWERWSLKPGWTPRLMLEDVLVAASGKGRLFLDLKGREEGLAAAVAAAVRSAGAHAAVAFSTPEWAHLDRVAELLPAAPRFYTIGTLDALEARRPRLTAGGIAALSVKSQILTEELVGKLHAYGVETIVTWDVETPEAACRVLSWGVSGITSKNLGLLRAVVDGTIDTGSKG